MSNLNKPTASAAREAYQQLLLNQPKLAPPKPELHPDNPLLPDLAGDPDTDQLPLRLHGVALKVLVNKFDTQPTPVAGTVQLTWNGAAVGSAIRFMTPIPDGDFPFTFNLPANNTVNPGRYNLGYVVEISGNPDPSDSKSINIDTMPPNGNGKGMPVVLPPEVEANGITKEYLDANNFVLVTIPDYNDPREGDVIKVWYGHEIPTSTLVDTIIRDDINNAATTQLTEAHIGSNEGTQSIFYTLGDRVGNEGPYSEFKTFQVTLTPAPTNLKPPTVPEGDDGLVDLEDAYSDFGVGVVIDIYDDHVAATDKVVVAWDGIPQLPKDVVSFPTFVNVPYSGVVGTTGTGLKTSHVTYKIVRGNREYPELTGVDVEVDLRKPGPDNPDDPPGTVNPVLPLVDVQGAVTTELNKLTPADNGQDATAKVVIYEPHVAGELIQLYWKGVAIPAPDGEYRVLGTEPVGFEVPFTIPWAVIDAGGNGVELPVHYTIAHPAINDNIDTSPPQKVEVSVKTANVPDPEFQNLFTDPDGNQLLNCGSLVNDPVVGWSIAVRVPGGEPQLAAQRLTFLYQGWTDASGTIVKPGTQFTFNFTPSVEQANNGFVVHVPYDPPVLATLTDYGSIEYMGVLDGFPITSGRDLKQVYMALTGGETCRLP